MEKQPEAFLESSRSLGEWPKFRESLIGLTDVVRSYFEKLVLVSGACHHFVTRSRGRHPAGGEGADTAGSETAVLAHQPCTVRAWLLCCRKVQCQRMPQRGCTASGRGVTTP